MDRHDGSRLEPAPLAYLRPEAGQTVQFVASVDKPGLLATAPSISSDGTLTYRPKALSLGTATVTVRAVDDGGTANGGSDTSPAVTFTITIV